MNASVALDPVMIGPRSVSSAGSTATLLLAYIALIRISSEAIFFDVALSIANPADLLSFCGVDKWTFGVNLLKHVVT